METWPTPHLGLVVRGRLEERGCGGGDPLAGNMERVYADRHVGSTQYYYLREASNVPDGRARGGCADGGHGTAGLIGAEMMVSSREREGGTASLAFV